MKRAGRRVLGRRLALGLLAAWLAGPGGAGCGREPDPAPRLPHLEGNLYQARVFGFAIEKPPDWRFLPETALREDAGAPIDDPGELWSRLHRGGVVPLVAMSAGPEADPRVTPVVEVHAVPARPQDRSLVTSTALLLPPERILAGRVGERARNPGFQVLRPAEPVEVGGHPAAVTRLAYRLADDQGEERPVEELMWFFRRGKVFFYLIETGPAPLSEEVVETFERIAHSVRIDS